MFEHLDLGNLVVAFGNVDRSIIAQFELDEIAEAHSLDFGGGEVELRLRKRHAMALGAVDVRRMTNQAAPAAADVEQSIAGLQTKLATDLVELCCLGILERSLRSFEIPARVDHLRIEKQSVEGVRPVVMKPDQFIVLASPAETGLDLLIVARRLVAPRGRKQEWQRAAQRDLPIEVLRQIQRFEMIEATREHDRIGADAIEFLLGVEGENSREFRLQHQTPDGVGRANDDSHVVPRVGPQRQDFPVPKLHAEVAPEKLGEVGDHGPCGLQTLRLDANHASNSTPRASVAVATATIKRFAVPITDF